MFSLEAQASRLCDGISRREVLRAGGLSVLGLSLPGLLRASENAALGVLPTDKAFGRAKSIIFLWLAGGPPQHETFDPKPNAPLEIRGPFKPISTNVPGIQFCELLPRTAAMADKLAIVRSLSTNDNTHDSSGYWIWTGYKYQGPNSRTIQPTDWPYFGSLVKRLKPSDTLPPLSTVWLPDIARLNENVTPAGQTGGILGQEWDVDRFVGDPAAPNYQVEGLRLAELPPLRINQRQQLLRQVEQHFAAAERGEAVRLFDRYQQQAFDLLTSGKAREAFAIEKEPDKLRDRYGRNRWGQCVLLARRLIESGVRLVHVQWPREPGDNAVDNPLWDTHAQNAERVEDVLCPMFDQGYTALIEDLSQRGLLDETLVVAVGEFGRTPKINGNGGRDHWGPVFCAAFAGAGIAGGQVHGSSDKDGAYPATDKVEPPDFTATLFHLLGIPSTGTFADREGREHRLTLGQPLHKLLGIEPATRDRCECTGDPARVPFFDEKAMLLDPDFTGAAPLMPADGPARPRGWKAAPLDLPGLVVQKRSGEVVLGISHAGAAGVQLAKGQLAILAQEVRSPFSGTFRVKAQVCGEATDREWFEGVFLKQFTCKLLLFEYTDPAKKATARKDHIALAFTPAWCEAAAPRYEPVELTREFVNPTPGSNFSFGRGLGVAIVVEKTGDVPLELPARPLAAYVRLKQIDLQFTGKPRNEDVKV
ncbi:MAG: DUF1501 domain-containing protein [Planctomycetaceae bacterium]|nr:DUF1501 domain-containing protein [Planctomycetaceae bacterium]